MVQGNNRIVWLLYYTAISWSKTNAIRFAYCMILIYQYRILLLHCTVLCRVHKKTMLLKSWQLRESSVSSLILVGMHALPWLALTRLCAVQYYCGQTFSIYSCEYFLSCKPRCNQKIVLQLLRNHCCCNKMTKYLDTAKRGITTTDKPIHICRQYKCAVYILVVFTTSVQCTF